MAFLAAHVILAFGIGLTARTVQSKNLDFFLVTGVNYLVGFAGALLWTVLSGGWQADAPTIIFGLLQGTNFATSMVGSYLMFQRVGLGVTFTLIYISMIIPTVASSIVFGEKLSVFALAGVLLLVISVPLVGRRPNKQLASVAMDWRYWALVVGLIAITGAGQTGAKAFEELSSIGHRPSYVATAFATAVPIALATFMVRHRLQPGLQRVRGAAPVGKHQNHAWKLGVPPLIGIGFGVANASQLAFFVQALRDVPGTVAFPVATATLVLLSTLAGHVFWHERHGRITIAGGVLAITGLVFINF